LVYRLFTVLPEPEIYLPPGTDLRLRLNVPLYVATSRNSRRYLFQMDETTRRREMLLQKNTARTFTGKGKEADLVNVLFLGSTRSDGCGVSNRGLDERGTTFRRAACCGSFGPS